MSRAPQPYDLVIVGASFAGLAAAKTAAMRGLKVAVLEAKPSAGHSVKTAGILFSEAAGEVDIPHALTRRVYGVRLYAPNLKSFALCDGLHMPHVKRHYAKRAGIIKDDKEWNDEVDAKFDFRIAGPNHFTWLLKAEYDGKDVSAGIAEQLRLQAAKETDGGDIGELQ